MKPQKARAVPKTFAAYKVRPLINAEDSVHLSVSFVFRVIFFFANEFFI